VCVCKCYLDRVEPAERRKRDEQVDDTRNPLGKRVPLWADIIFLIWSRGAWGCQLCITHFERGLRVLRGRGLGERAISWLTVRLLLWKLDSSTNKNALTRETPFMVT
jgi:hypothetical protein